MVKPTYITVVPVNKKRHFSSFIDGFRKLLLQSDVELPRQAENVGVEQFRHIQND